MSHRNKRRYGECPYCGRHRKLTPDHIIPRCLFKGKIDNARLIIDACDDCNSARKSQNDNFLRDMVALDFANTWNPLAKDCIAAMERARANNQSEFGRALDQSEKIEIFNQKGESIAIYSPFTPEIQARVIEIYATIVRGLYYQEFNERLPADTRYSVNRISSEKYYIHLEHF